MDFKFEICIKKFRLGLGISQKQLSIRAGLTQGYIAKLETPFYITKKHSPTWNTLCNISKVLKVCPYILLKCKGNCETCNLKH